MRARTLAGSTFVLLLAACSSGTTYVAPEHVQPVYQVRNTPVPVPRPNWKPKPPSRYAAAPVRQQAVKRDDGPVPQEVQVRRGDTVYAISRRTGVQVRSLITLNNLKSPYVLQPGQTLALPTTRMHTVKRGETGYGIAQQYGVQVSELMRINRIGPPYSLAVGQKLMLPASGARTTVAANSPRRRPATTSSGKKWTGPLPEPPARTGSYFSWPVRGGGKVVSRFGPKDGGMHNDGVNISASAGTAVLAAEDGVVAYASDQLPGYGNMILIKHAEGWITAYAHNESLSVQKGDRVRRGQVIGRVGETGGVKQPQLHFEIRKGRRALDPLRYLRQG